MLFCNDCGQSFTRSDNLRRHQKNSCIGSVGPSTAKKPRLDIAALATTSNLPTSAAPSTSIAPSRTAANAIIHKCICCDKNIPADKMTAHKRTLEHRTNACVNHLDGVYVIESAFKCRIISYRLECRSGILDYNTFFEENKETMVSLLENMLSIHHAIKVNMEMFGRYVIESKDIHDNKSFITPNHIVDSSLDLASCIDAFKDIIVNLSTEFEERDSGWALEKILFLEININRYSPLRGCSYVKLPSFIEKKKAVVNVVNNDECCFAWAVTSAFYPTSSRPCETSSYPHFSTVLNMVGIEFPVKVRSIPKFEDQNDCSINVYGLERVFENQRVTYLVVGPLHYSKKRMSRHVNLLLVTDDETGESHYCWIRNLSRLVSSQISANEHKKYFCDGCLLYFHDESKLLRHKLSDCNQTYTTTPSTQLKVDKFGIEIPENILKFENFEKQMKVPFVIYADFESVLKPIHTCEPDPKKSYTNRTFRHEPYSFAYLIKCSYDNSITKFVTFRGKDAAKKFVSSLVADSRKIYDSYLKHIVPMKKLTAAEEVDFVTATVCGICEKPFSRGEVKVRDHCHLTGEKRFGAAHSICNLNYKIPNFIPVFFHNMSGYDSHLFIKELFDRDEQVDCVAQTKEKYISFTKHILVGEYMGKDGKNHNIFLKLRFLDSYKFLSQPLQSLVGNLNADQFVETRRYFQNGEQFNVMMQKGVFPYSFITSMDKLDVANLPSKNEFYDNLSNQHISDEDYRRAQRVWNLFKCKSLGDYSDIYLKSDVLLLCDVFENFRKVCLKSYKLDPCQYFTAPGLSWDAMLRYTKIELELLTDIDMINFFKKGIRGGISQCSLRSHVANNSFLPNFNPNEPTSYIMYLDATNLYGHSMSQPLPTSGFVWLSVEEISELDVMSIADDNSCGYVLEVDVHYPAELHDAHADLPFLVESIPPPCSSSKLPKLIPNLFHKSKYIVHYRNLKQALRNGLVLVKTHRVLKFNQSPWLKKYVDLNTEMRNKSTNKADKCLYKNMVNSVYGKTMENVDKRTDIKLVTHWDSVKRRMGANALIAQPNYKTCKIFHEDFVAIHMGKVKVHYDKPLYLGFSILDVSKVVIYDFLYECIKKNFADKSWLLYSDTDSLILKIETENFYNFMKENIGYFDTSNYPVNNQMGIPITRSVVGNMKDEFPADPIISFYGTGAKAYYVQSVGSELKKAKGVSRSVVRSQLTLDDYKNIVEKGGLIFRKMNCFRSDYHDIYTEMKNKVALSYHDDKRFIIPNTSRTLPWGHNDIEFYGARPEDNVLWFQQAIIAQVETDCNEQSNDSKLDELIRLLEMEQSQS